MTRLPPLLTISTSLGISKIDTLLSKGSKWHTLSMVKVSRRVLAIFLVSALATSRAQAVLPTPQTLKVTLKVKVAKDFTFIGDLLKALKADGVIFTKYSKSAGILGVREEGTCTFNKQVLTLDLFADDKSAVSTINAVKAMATGYILGLNNWGISVDDGTTAKILQSGLKLKLY